MVTPAETSPVVRGHDGSRYVMADYFGSHAVAADGLQAYLVRQESPELRAHFHEVDQFQVVLEGSGSLGREPVTTGTLHYADAFTTYGPIRTDPDAGLAYFTLRLLPTTGLNYMPEARKKRRPVAGRTEHFTCVLDDSLPLGERPRELRRTAGGGVACGARLPAGAGLDAADLPERQGYAVVLTGALKADGRLLPAGSLVAFSRPAELAALRADEGAGRDSTVAILVFPDPSD